MTTTDFGFHDDTGGFWSRECPSCERLFKVKSGSSSPKPVTHCPYCDHEGEGCWGTVEQARHIELFEKYAGVQAAIAKSKEPKVPGPRRTRGESAPVKVKVPQVAPNRPIAPDEPETDMPTVWFDCCEESVRHDGDSEEVRCPFCGEAAD